MLINFEKSPGARKGPGILLFIILIRDPLVHFYYSDLERIKCHRRSAHAWTISRLNTDSRIAKKRVQHPGFPSDRSPQY